MGEGKNRGSTIALDHAICTLAHKVGEGEGEGSFMARYSSLQKGRARRLRENQTDVEKKLWSQLRGRQLSGVKFRRQHPIGPFIVDFCCVERGLVVELDGGQHAELNVEDEQRTRLLERFGYRVLRFWNDEIFSNLDAVSERITEALEDPHMRPRRLRERGSPI
jgi:very-short-patch-repair endonuclease